MGRKRVEVTCAIPHVKAQIAPYSQSPRYWENDGRPTLLSGGSDTDNIFQWADDGSRPIDQLALLRRCGGNYIRCALHSRQYTAAGHRWDLLPYPYAKANGKYDLRRS